MKIKKVTKNMKIGEVISKSPKAAEIMMLNGLHCVGCGVSLYESIEEGCLAHGLDKKQINKIIKEINKTIEN